MTQTNEAPQQAQALTPFQVRSMELREQIAASEPMAIVPRTFAEAQAFASALRDSDIIPKALRDNAPNILMMILAGAELGVAPIAAMRVFHVIEGVPKLSADGIAALCMRSPICEYLEPRHQANDRVVWATKRRDRPQEVVLEWTHEDSERAGLFKKTSNGADSNHTKYPRAMKNARCKAELCRLVYPEICAGMLSAEEARDVDAIDAEFTETKTSGFGPLPTGKLDAQPTNTNAKPATKAPDPNNATGAADAQSPTAPGECDEPAAAEPPADAPLTDDDVAFLANRMRECAKEKDVKGLASVGADVAKLKTNPAQRKYLADTFRKCQAEIKGAA